MLEELKRLVRIPSVSFDGFPAEEVDRSAHAVADLFKRIGLEHIELLSVPGGKPYVYADWLHAPGAPTLLLYAHHDVQPPGRAELWKTPPFEPTLQEGPGGMRLYGRGAADDKAGVIVHAAAIAAHLREKGKLPVNVKLVIEGEEEVGSTTLPDFLKTYRKKLDADVLVLTDTTNFDCGVPALTVALRGLVGVEVEVRALTKSVHSGMWGGPLPDPVQALAKMLAQLSDEQGRINIPGIREQWHPLSKAEEVAFEKIPYNEKEFREQSGLIPQAQILSEGPSPSVQVFRYPSVTVNAIQASSRAQPSNIICDTAWAKVTIRVAGGMEPEKCLEILQEFLRSKCPWGLQVEFKTEACNGAWSIEPTGPAFEAAERALTEGYGKAPLKIGCGGSIPFVEPFALALGGAPALLIGVEDPYTNAHGENESLLVSDLLKACMSQAILFEELAKTLTR